VTDLYEDLPARSRTAVTYALLGCAFLGMLDGTVVGTALPRIVEQLGGSGSWYVWLVTAQLGGTLSLACTQSLLAGPRVTAGGLGATVAWIGGVAGVPAVAAKHALRDTAVTAPPKVPARP
jgi:MFS family permease